MKKIKTTFVLAFLLLFSISIFAQKVSKKEAINFAQKFISIKAPSENFSIDFVSYYNFEKTNTLFIVNFKPKGFVILPTTKQLPPILAYSTEHNIPKEITNEEVRWILDNYSKQVVYAIKNNLPTREWSLEKYLSTKGNKSVEPLIQTHWDQTGGYNDYCPGESAAGCVAIAMAQYMKYWNYPPQGLQWNGYRHPPFSNHDWGYLRAIFEKTNYRWQEMENNSATDAAAELIYHCGVAVNMFYTPPTSAASSNDVPIALANYFGYSQNAKYLYRDNYTDSLWKLILMEQLDAAKPILYAGSGSSGGHMFICDGYDTDTLFHFNWGWGGYADGYYEISNLNPAGYDFSNYNTATIDATPEYSNFTSFTSKVNGFPQRFTSVKDMFIVNDKVVWTIPYDAYPYDSVVFYQQCAKSFNSGNDWKVFDLPLDSTFMPVSVWAKDTTTAMVAAVSLKKFNNNEDRTVILKTSDGGYSWQNIFDENIIATTLFQLDTNLYLIERPHNGAFHIYKYENNAWTILTYVFSYVNTDEYFIPSKYFYIQGFDNRIFIPTTKGRVLIFNEDESFSVKTIYQVSSQDSTVINLAFNDDFSDSRKGIAVVKIYRADTLFQIRYFVSSDNGNNWSEFQPNGKIYPTDLGFDIDEGKFVSSGSDLYYDSLCGISFSEDAINWELNPQYYYSNLFTTIRSGSNIYIGGFSIGYSGLIPHKWGFWTKNYSLPTVADFYSKKLNNSFDTLFCYPEEVVFVNNSTGENPQYQWYFQDGTPEYSQASDSVIVSFNSAGKKQIKLVVSDQYEKDSLIKFIYIAEQSPSVSEIQGDTLVLLATTHTYTTDYNENSFYKWDKEFTFWEGESDSASIDIYFGGFKMSGNISVFAYNGCGTSDTVFLKITTTDNLSKVENDNTINLWPNPANDFVIINANENLTLKIYTVNGILLKKQNLSKGKNLVPLKLESGTYIFEFENRENKTIKKVQIF